MQPAGSTVNPASLSPLARFFNHVRARVQTEFSDRSACVTTSRGARIQPETEDAYVRCDSVNGAPVTQVLYGLLDLSVPAPGAALTAWDPLPPAAHPCLGPRQPVHTNRHPSQMSRLPGLRQPRRSVAHSILQVCHCSLRAVGGRPRTARPPQPFGFSSVLPRRWSFKCSSPAPSARSLEQDNGHQRVTVEATGKMLCIASIMASSTSSSHRHPCG